MNKVLRKIDSLRAMLPTATSEMEKQLIRERINKLQISLLGELVMRG